MIFTVSIILAFALGEDGYYALYSNVYFNTLMSTLPLYVVGLPICYVTLRNVPVRKINRTGMRTREFLALIPVSFALMILGNYIGVAINEFFAILKGDEISNSTIDALSSAPAWLSFVLAIVIGPIIEEFIFRKLLIDRLSVYGSVFAIVLSSVAFGLFHGNLYQFFYAALLGAVLGYIYVNSGSWLLSALMHIILNFLGGFLPMLLDDAMVAYNEFAFEYSELLASGGDIDAFIEGISSSQMASLLFVSLYVMLQYALIIGGVVILVLAIRKGWIHVDNSCTVKIPKGRTGTVVFKNVGSILFLVFTALTMILSITA